MTIIKVMNSFMRHNIGLVILAILLGLLTVIFNVGLLSTSAVLISWASLMPPVLDLMVLIVAVRFFGIFRAVLRYAERIISHDTTLRILSKLRVWVFKKFNEEYCEENIKYKTGEIYTILVNDVEILKEFFLRGLYPLFISILTGIIVTIFLSYFNVTFSIVYMLLYFISGFIIPYVLLKKTIRIIEKESENRTRLNLLLIDSLNGLLEINLYNKEQYYLAQFKDINKEFLELQNKKNFINIFSENINGIVVVILMAISLLVNGIMVNSGQLEGLFFAMIPLSIMASFEAIVQSNNSFYKIYESKKAWNNIEKIVENKSDNLLKVGKLSDENKKLCLEINSITIEDNGKKLLDNISFKADYGKKIAIVGSTGSGKTTLLRTLLAFNNIKYGEIIIGDNKYSQLNSDCIRSLYAYVDQSPYIFNATIEENIKIAKRNIEKEKLFEVVRKVKLDALVNSLPQKEETLIWQYGASISGGEKERIAIARSIIKESKILLLDEPTAGLDLETEKEILSTINEEFKEKTVILATHRLVNMDSMDEILVLDKGKIVEQGTHVELLRKKGKYYYMYIIQEDII